MVASVVIGSRAGMQSDFHMEPKGSFVSLYASGNTCDQRCPSSSSLPPGSARVTRRHRHKRNNLTPRTCAHSSTP